MKHKIVVVGAGTAGIMAATYFKSYWGDLVDITLLYDHKQPGIGVGESLTPLFDSYLKYVGLTTVDLIKNCNATIKLGLKFKNWTKPDHFWSHGFHVNETLIQTDQVAIDFNIVDAYDILHDRYDNGFMYSNDYFIDNANTIPNKDNLVYRHALHIDAGLLSKYIESRFVDKINIVDGEIVHVEVKDQTIQHLKLEDGREISADIYFDVSGFSKILFKNLGAKWKDVTDLLPVNRTILNPLFKDFDTIPPYTQAEASKNGWIFNIPLSNRKGTGYIYCSDITSDEEALQDYNQWLLKNFNTELNGNNRIISFSNGHWDKSWINNCVSLGLANSFLEPLEATSIHHAWTLLQQFVNLYDFNHNKLSIDLFNKFSNQMYENSLRYLKFFYTTKRTDSEFWKYVNSRSTEWLDDFLEKLEASFISKFDIDDGIMFNGIDFVSVAYGHGYFKNKKSIENYLRSRYMYDYAAYLSERIRYQKQELKKHHVDHKQWIQHILNNR